VWHGLSGWCLFDYGLWGWEGGARQFEGGARPK
jgi:hypothetical protein